MSDFQFRDPNDPLRPHDMRNDMRDPDDEGASYGLAGLVLGAIFVAAILAFVFSGNNNEGTQTAANDTSTPAISRPVTPPPTPANPSGNPSGNTYRTVP